MLDKKDAIRVDVVEYGESLRFGKFRKQKVYIFLCVECKSEIRSQGQHLIKHSGKCVSCSQFNDPYRASYNELIRTCERRDREISLTYEDFLTFTKISECHYCRSKIIWHPHTKKNGREVLGSRSYKLDRMDNNLGYTKINCVVCCWKCNSAKGNKYTYEEWYGMTAFLRNKNLDIP